MRINHNITSLNTYRQLSSNSANQAKSIEKLSSGLRINRAGDDAAGLAISEKMRGQIRGLDQASRNAQDGISLIQTAEGALNETHSILQRMRELAVQSANDTNTTDDRAEIQKEIDQLVDEIDRVGNDTEFNTRKLLNGGAGIKVTASNANVTNMTGTADTKGGSTLAVTGLTSAAAAKVTYGDTATLDWDAAATTGTSALGIASSVSINGTSFSFADTALVNDVVASINEQTGATGVSAAFTTSTGLVLTSTGVGESAKINITTNGVGAFANLTSADNAAGANAQASITGGTLSINGDTVSVESGDFKGLEFKVATGLANASTNITTGTNNSLTFQIGANATQNIGLSVNDMRSSALGVDAIDVNTQPNADQSITTINKAIGYVSAERSKLGALQNRLDHTINNLGTSSENLSAAESRIRDVDMAKEMMEQTKNSILSQAAQAMLAQANQQPQGVLQLLR